MPGFLPHLYVSAATATATLQFIFIKTKGITLYITQLVTSTLYD